MDIIAQNHSNKHFGKFWKTTNKLNSEPSLPISVGGAHEPGDIDNAFRRQFRVQPPVAKRRHRPISLATIINNLHDAQFRFTAGLFSESAILCLKQTVQYYTAKKTPAYGAAKPFERVLWANVGDCHALGQPPVTFIRQVLAAASWPQLLQAPQLPPSAAAELPADVRRRTALLLQDCTNGSVGAYSPAAGLPEVRAHVADFLAARDGVGARAADVWLGAGATDLIRAVLALFAGAVDGKPPAVMIPVPQYPLFSCALAELGVARADYFLDEAQNWTLRTRELRRAHARASRSHAVRALVVINPGNPTGQVLTRVNIEEIIKFALEHQLFLIADEVYQENIVCKPFHSFKKVMHEMGSPYSSMELASFGTSSKGWAAECGARAGWLELVRAQPCVRRAFAAARSYVHCPSVLGQCALDCIVKPPTSGDPSYEQFLKEKNAIHRTLTECTATAYHAFNSIPGYECNPIDGAMFAFPRIDIPDQAQEEARERGMEPDEFYCLQLLEETGVCVVPGGAFGQRPRSFHFRAAILHPPQQLRRMLHRIAHFHHRFLQHYSP